MARTGAEQLPTPEVEMSLLAQSSVPALAGHGVVIIGGTGGLGLAALAVSQGARIIRAHDIAPTVDAIGVVAAVIQGSADT